LLESLVRVKSGPHVNLGIPRHGQDEHLIEVRVALILLPHVDPMRSHERLHGTIQHGLVNVLPGR
jgi:hypothetical protein